MRGSVALGIEWELMLTTKDRGCTARQAHLYHCACDGCGEMLGSRKFEAKDLKKHLLKGGPLLCEACRAK